MSAAMLINTARPIYFDMNPTRRSVLAAVGAGATIGLAGCLGGDEVETSYDCDLEEPDSVSSLDPPAIGDEDAPVTLQLFEDYGCGGCAAFATNVFSEIEADYVDSGQLRIEHYDLPIPVSDDWSYQIASAARSVQDTVDDEAFFSFSKAVYEDFGDYSWQLVGDLADGVGADPCTALAAGSHQSYRDVSDAEKEHGLSIGIEGTPGIVVDGSIVAYDSPGDSYGPVSDAIEAALE